MSDTNMLLKTIYNIDSTLKDRRNLKQICQLVSTRAARLAAVGISAIVTKTNRLNGATVGIDGSVYEHYQHFGNHVKDALRELLGMVAQNVTLAQGEFLKGGLWCVYEAIDKSDLTIRTMCSSRREWTGSCVDCRFGGSGMRT